MDFARDKIYNEWILFGILVGLVFHMWENGWYGVCSALIPMMIPFALLYPIYKIGALGAGDIKLFMASGAFLKTEVLVHVIIVSFIIAAPFSLMKMLSERNCKERKIHFALPICISVMLGLGGLF